MRRLRRPGGPTLEPDPGHAGGGKRNVKPSLKVDDAALRGITRGPLPGSRKAWTPGTLHPSVRVPYREIALSPTSGRPNAAVAVYDPSGPYTDVEASFDLRRGLDPSRAQWIQGRGDVEELGQISSEYGRRRLADPRLNGLRFPRTRGPSCARSGRNVSQLHYARKGIVTPEMEFVALRESHRLAAGG